MTAARRLMLCATLLPAAAFGAVTCTPSNNSILFGTYDPFSVSTLDSTATFIITCVNTANQATINYTATLSGQALRQLAPTAGADRLNYNLYTDPNRTTIWGNGTGGTATFTGTLTVPKKSSVGSPPITYYGRISAGQDVSATASGSAPSTYSQSLTITVTCTPQAC